MFRKEYILCAAWKRKSPREMETTPYKPANNDILLIELGYRHHDIEMRFGDELDTSSCDAMGFYTSRGRFVSRLEAMEIALAAGQVTDKQAHWSAAILEWLPVEGAKPGDLRPLSSEDLYCCSPDGNTMNE